ncbi:MAG: hypothetical protein ACKVZ0_04715 [Gemmatimonadales bacterium]
MAAKTTETSPPAGRPEIIVDFTVDDGLLHVHLKNIGARSAYAVSTAFDQPLLGLAGTKRITEMRLFRKVEFMPPGKAFAQFVDAIGSYAKRKQPLRLTATVGYRDREGNRFEDRFVHDLRIYLELGTATINRSGSQGDEHGTE